VFLTPVVKQRERATECNGKACRIMALHWQAAAFFWSIGREGGDDDECTGGGSSQQCTPIGVPLLRV